ncbi:MAG: hypothetical protein Q9224_006302, partial [Gallowayella concinna]
MLTKGISLVASSRSGHPMVHFDNASPPTKDFSSGHDKFNAQNGIMVSPHGTWRQINGPGTASIKVLDLTSRFAYAPHRASKPNKVRPKNALKKGRRPTRMSELPPGIPASHLASPSTERQSIPEPLPCKVNTELNPTKLTKLSQSSQAPSTAHAMAATRLIYRNPSTDNEGQTLSEPLPKKLPIRMDSRKRESATISSMTYKRQLHQISSDEEDDHRTLAEPSPLRTKALRLMTRQSVNPNHSSTTVNAEDDQFGPTNPHLPSTMANNSHSSSRAIAASIPQPIPTASSVIEHPRLANPIPPYLNTILRIYIPTPTTSTCQSRQSTRTYVPVKLHSVCNSSANLFAQAAIICERDIKDIVLLKMRFDWEDEDASA